MGSSTPPVFAGIDVSKARLDVALSFKEQWSENNDEAGIRTLARRLREDAPELVVLEASGGFETAVAAALGRAGLPVVIVNPLQVRKWIGTTMPQNPALLPTPLCPASAAGCGAAGAHGRRSVAWRRVSSRDCCGSWFHAPLEYVNLLESFGRPGRTGPPCRASWRISSLPEPT